MQSSFPLATWDSYRHRNTRLVAQPGVLAGVKMAQIDVTEFILGLHGSGMKVHVVKLDVGWSVGLILFSIAF